MNNKNITWVEGIPDFHTNTFFERKEEENEKQNLVVKSNVMIQKSRYNLSLQEQKVILYCISKIKPQDKQFNIINVDIKKLIVHIGNGLQNIIYSILKQFIKIIITI